MLIVQAGYITGTPDWTLRDQRLAAERRAAQIAALIAPGHPLSPAIDLAMATWRQRATERSDRARRTPAQLRAAICTLLADLADPALDLDKLWGVVP